MRAARLLQILLILQNRGRQTSVQLAEELEVSPRTILRDVDAMTEAGLPIIVHQGNQGGIELGFNYRTRLTGLAREEAMAMGLILAAENPMIAALGLDRAAHQARAKLVESFPDQTRHHVQAMMSQFQLVAPAGDPDPRIAPVARAIQQTKIVRLRYTSPSEQIVHPVALMFDGTTWCLNDARADTPIALQDWGRVNISARSFARL